MTKSATFALTDGVSDVLEITVQVDRDFPDQWFKDAQDYFAGSLPAEITWTTVVKGYPQVQDPPREIEPNA